MEERVLNAALAGLLHDIGKLEQRAQMDPRREAPGIDREGQPVHATWTQYFVQQYVPPPYRPAALAGAYHHSPEKSPASDKSLSELVALADKLSAGERADPEEGDSPDQGKKQPPRQMVTIFDRIQMGKETKQAGWHYLPLRQLALDEAALFPGEAFKPEEEGTAYANLAEALREAARKPIANGETYLENLQGALQQVTWAVPSAYYHSMPDVSLYDHSRMTAALAACLTEKTPDQVHELLGAVQRQFQGQATTQDQALLETPVALLLGGDLSGVQDFIYTISSKGAAKTLRGRSFYLQLLTEAVLRFVLGALGLPCSNVIYSGGAHFFLLAPPSAAQALPAIRKGITERLLTHHGTSLYLALGYTLVPASGFAVGRFPDFWGEMHAQLAQAKNRRYSELEGDLHQRIFVPPAQGGNPDSTCSVCGEERPVKDWDIEREEQDRICALCESFINELGASLPEARFLVLGSGNPQNTPPGTARDALAAFGLQIQFLKDAREAIHLPGAERATIWALDDTADGPWPTAGELPASHLLHYTLKRVPALAFDELQEKSASGFKRLGVLRMDVDNLGELFKNGLGEAATLARLSTLSFQVSLYFEGWVKRLCELPQYAGLIYPVYAGGDDLFLIGPWDSVPGLARRINADFARYTAGHPALHASGGMAFIGGKYPVYQAADDADNSLGQAKDQPGKNAFSFLGRAWAWETFAHLEEKKERLLRIVGSAGEDPENLDGPQAILQVLRQLAQDEAESAASSGQRVWGPWMWRGAYLLTRMAERYKAKPALETAIRAIRDELNANNYGEIEQWGAAARWTQLSVRKESKQEKN
jgi:CRISPR-associated protein Csm1